MPGLTVERVEPLALGMRISELVTLVNAAYDAAEGSLWQIPLGRTNADEMQRWVAAGSVVVASVGGRLVGSVTSHLIDPSTGWFGALAVDPSWSGRGIASALVRFAEADAIAAAATSMQLEVLEPDPPQDHQVRLRAWYSAIGYRPFGQFDLADVDPDVVSHARYPTHIVVMRKTLGGAARSSEI